MTEQPRTANSEGPKIRCIGSQGREHKGARKRGTKELCSRVSFFGTIFLTLSLIPTGANLIRWSGELTNDNSSLQSVRCAKNKSKNKNKNEN